MKCADCPKFDKEMGCCGEIPSELENIVCLLRHICYSTNDIWQSLPENDKEEGDGGKIIFKIVLDKS